MDSSTTSPTTTTLATPANPTTPPFPEALEWRTAYLAIHVLSNPSRLYAFYLWAVVLAVFVVVATFNATGWRGGHIGARWAKWALRRRTWRGLIFHRKQPVCLPPNGQLLATAGLLLGTILFTFAGPDYIYPKTKPLDAFIDNTATSIVARSHYNPDSYRHLMPHYTINKAWWTVGGRTGLIAFALYPLCVLFALKAPPFALFAIPGLAQLHFDKLAWFHRWTGRLIWLVSATHVVAWSIQLAEDKREETGVRVIVYALTYDKYRYGWFGFVALTLIIILSISPMRRCYYEAFYFLHILLIPIALIGAAIHHPPIWGWCWTALLLWFGERIWRFVWWLRINGYAGGLMKSTEHAYAANMVAEAARLMPGKLDTWQMTSTKPKLDNVDPEAQGWSADSKYTISVSTNPVAYLPSSAMAYVPPPGYAHAELLSGMTIRVTLIPPSVFSWAPGQNFLLTIPCISTITSHPFTCASISDDESPKNSARALVFLIRAKSGWTKDLWDIVVTLLARYETHPRTEQLPSGVEPPTHGVLLRTYVDGPFGSSSRAQWGSHSTVILVGGGSGVSFALAILEYICACYAGRDGRHLGGRTGGWGKNEFNTTRIRFIWLIREFSHIQWGASILRRCMALVPPSALKVEIFVTNIKTIPNKHAQALLSQTHVKEGTDDSELLVPPLPDYARGRGSHSQSESRSSSVGSMASTDSLDRSSATRTFGDEELDVGEQGIQENYTLDLTNFDGDDDAALPGEDALSRRVIKAGKVRRANTRKAERAAKLDPLRRVMVQEDARLSEMDLGFPEGSTVDLPLPYSELTPSRRQSGTSSTKHSQQRSTSESYGGRHSLQPSTESYGGRHSLQPSTESYGGKHSRMQSLSEVYGGHSRPSSDHSRMESDGELASLRSLMSQTGEGSHGQKTRLEVADQEMRDIVVMSEHARPGKPKLDRILADEVLVASGSIIVGCCGPSSLNAIVRKSIAAQINPEHVKNGLMQGSISLISEEFAY